VRYVAGRQAAVRQFCLSENFAVEGKMSKAVRGREADSTLPIAGRSCLKDWQFWALSSMCFSFCSSLALKVWQWWVTSYLVQPVCLSQANLMLFRTCSNFGALLHSQRKFVSCFVNALKPSGHYMYHQFNIHKFYVLPTQCIYVFCVDLRTKSDYFPIQH